MDPLRARIQKYVARVIRWAVVVDDGGDAEAFPVQRVEALGMQINSQTFYPYGYNAVAPNGSLSLMWALGGDSSSRIHMPGSPNTRIRAERGEVVVFHPETKAKVHFKANGDIDVESPASVNISAAASVVIDAPTSVDITSTTAVNIDAPAIALDGVVTVTGTFNVVGDSDFTGRIGATSSVDVDYDLAEHVHLSNFATGPGDVDPPKD